MQNWTAPAILVIALCASFALGAVDVAVDVLSPRTNEPPGLVPMRVKLTNVGSLTALVPRLTVIARPTGYWDFREGIAIPVGESTTVTLNPWVYPGGTETCMVWIAYPDDDSSLNDWDAVIVKPAESLAQMRREQTGKGQVRFALALDVAAAFVSPRDSEEPGLIPVTVRITNVGTTDALVPRIDVNARPSGYADFRENIAVDVGENQVVTLGPWVYSGGSETCFTWITYDGDQNAVNDADVAMVRSSGISGRTETGPHTGMSLALSPSPVAGNVLRVEYSLSQSAPVNVTLFDISGRPVLSRSLDAARRGDVSVDLRSLSAGVYVVRLGDGQSSVTQKLVVQR